MEHGRATPGEAARRHPGTTLARQGLARVRPPRHEHERDVRRPATHSGPAGAVGRPRTAPPVDTARGDALPAPADRIA